MAAAGSLAANLVNLAPQISPAELCLCTSLLELQPLPGGLTMPTNPNIPDWLLNSIAEPKFKWSEAWQMCWETFEREGKLPILNA